MRLEAHNGGNNECVYGKFQIKLSLSLSDVSERGQLDTSGVYASSDDDAFYLFLQKHKMAAELHVLLGRFGQ